ncbi:dihydrofolate reductase [Diplodia corticola]|uniref:Dihydrofolate reductase n=1 Tax=Diplodia corticola TaxID=236234 RepID=A0A1J9RXU2_9PEZI|nr:dihydrofolate reductase [Diplodia corticola]OJD37467.1 dihydrofolate reductase [Diplodia corticola]
MAAANPTKPVKILMLHGYTQTGPLFRNKTRALEKNLAKAFPAGVSLSYPTAPIRLSRAQIPSWDTDGVKKDDAAGDDDEEEPEAYGWWTRKDKVETDRVPVEGEGFVYEGMDAGLARVAQVLRDEGPFDGVVGFSQGGAAAGMVASLLEPGRRAAFDAAAEKGGMPFPDAFAGADGVHPPLKFAVSYSGFAPAQNPLYDAFYNPKIKTPMLHFLGSVDTVVEEARSLRLAHACEQHEGRIVYHPGGHFLPSSQKQYVAALVGFIRQILADSESNGKKEESVEDMDVPF